MGKLDEWFNKKKPAKGTAESIKQNPIEEISPDFMDKGAEHVDPDALQTSKDEFHTASDMQDSILGLCSLLSKKVSEKEFEYEVWIKKFQTYLTMSSERIMYSSISNYIFGKDEEELTTFETNIDYVLHYVERKVAANTEDEQLRRMFKSVLKFYDHANLAIQQQKLVTRKRVDLEEEVEEILTPKISEITKEMTSQLVGLVSIFTALSFIVFGGISSLENMVTSLQGTLKDQQSILPILILAMAWAFCMMNLLFGFMYFVIRITNLEKPVDENVANVVQRYPVVFLCDYTILALLVLFSGMWFAKTAAVGSGIYKFLVNNHPDITFAVAILAFILVFSILGAVLFGMYKPEKKLNFGWLKRWKSSCREQKNGTHS